MSFCSASGSMIDVARIAARGKVAVLVKDEGHAAGHACGEVAPGAPENDHQPVGHIFAAVVAHALDDRGSAGVAHGESFAGHAAEVGFAAGGAVEADVAEEDIFLGDELRFARVIQNQPAAGKTLADVIVAVAFEFQRHALGQERAEALSRAAGKADVHGVVGQVRPSRSAGRFRR